MRMLSFAWLGGVLALALVLVLSLTYASPSVQAADKNTQLTNTDDLLELLIEKEIITQDEAAALKNRAAERAEQKKEETKATQAQPPKVDLKVRLETRYSSVQRDEGQPNWGSKDDVAGGDGFTLRRARFHVLGKLNPDVSYTAVFNSDFGATNPSLLIGCMEWNGWKNATLKMGMTNVPFGWEVQTNDSIYLQTDLSAMSTLLPADKDLGLRLESKKPIFGNTNYEIMVANGSGRNTSNPNHSLLVAGRLFTQLAPGLSFGLSGSRNPNTNITSYQSRFLKANSDPYNLIDAYSAAKVDENAWGLDFQYSANRNTLRGEYMRMNIDPGNFGPELNAGGYYLVYGRGVDLLGVPERLELVAGLQKFDPNTSVKDKYDLKSYLLGMNLHVGNSKRYSCPVGSMPCQSMLRLNYIWNYEGADSVKNNKWIMQYQTWF